MKCLPPAIAATDIVLGTNVYLGGEFQVFVSDTAAIELGTITQTSSGNGTAFTNYGSYTPAAGTSIVGIGGTGADLQMVAEERLTSAVPCVVTLNVLDSAGATTTATATFTPPARATNQGFNFMRGYAVDLVVETGLKIAAIISVSSIVGGSRGCSFSIYQMPELATYQLVGTTTEKKFNTKSRAAVGIDIGMEGDAQIKLGKTKKGELTIDSKLGSMADGLMRFDGARTTVMLVGMKEEVLVESNLFFMNCILSVEITAPEGDGESMANAATGKFADHAFFIAP